MNKQNKKPLYKVLNEERTQGEWDNNLHDGNVTSGGLFVGNFNSMMVSKRTTNANAKYTALCVNNLASLSEALETTLKAMTDLVRQLPRGESLADYNLDYCEIAEQKAKEALSRIS